jgi:hypothetical protein
MRVNAAHFMFLPLYFEIKRIPLTKHDYPHITQRNQQTEQGLR